MIIDSRRYDTSDLGAYESRARVIESGETESVVVIFDDIMGVRLAEDKLIVCWSNDKVASNTVLRRYRLPRYLVDGADYES